MPTQNVDINCKVIKAVEKHECIWNADNKYNRNSSKVGIAWKAVAREVGQPVSFCREKWRNVRIGFLRSLQRKRDGQVAKKFYLHKHMKFLLKADGTCAYNGARKATPDESSDESRETSTSEYETESSVSSTSEDTTNSSSLDHIDEPNVTGKEQTFETPSLFGERSLFEKTYADQSELQTSNDVGDANKKPNEGNEEQTKQISLESDGNFEQPPKSGGCPPNSPDFSGESGGGGGKDGSKLMKSRGELLLMNFFRSNVDDVLALSKRSQRLFKKKMINIIDELHDEEIEEKQ